MEKKDQYKGCQSDADKIAHRLICPFKVQRDGIAKVIKFFHVDVETTNLSNSLHGMYPKHLMKNFNVF